MRHSSAPPIGPSQCASLDNPRSAASAEPVGYCTRCLSKGEKVYLRATYKDTIDLDAVRLRKSHRFGLVKATGAGAMTYLNLISFRSDDWQSNFVFGNTKHPGVNLLAHEVGHVWQYQNRQHTKYTWK